MPSDRDERTIALLAKAEHATKMSRMSNKQLAEMMLEHVLDVFGSGDPVYFVVSESISRLHVMHELLDSGEVTVDQWNDALEELEMEYDDD